MKNKKKEFLWYASEILLLIAIALYASSILGYKINFDRGLILGNIGFVMKSYYYKYYDDRR